MFDDSGEYIKSIGDGVLGRCFGLATNGKGRLFTINTNYRGEKGNMTEKGHPNMTSTRLLDFVAPHTSGPFKFSCIINIHPPPKCERGRLIWIVP